jgi:hypothetical protein
MYNEVFFFKKNLMSEETQTKNLQEESCNWDEQTPNILINETLN